MTCGSWIRVIVKYFDVKRMMYYEYLVFGVKLGV